MQEQTPKNGKRILAVDDEQVVRTLLKRHLGSLGYTVETAETGERALVALNTMTPDLILMDIKMPGMGGIECLRVLRGRFPHLPVIMLTAVLHRETAVQAVQHGASDYLFKPVDLTVLTDVVNRHVGQSQKD